MAKLDLKKLLDRVELTSEFNFESFTGFAVKDAAKGTVGALAYQLNVNDNLEPELKNTVIQGILDDYVYPAIMHRVAKGTLPSSYKPTLVHMSVVRIIEYFSNHILNDEIMQRSI